MSIESRFRHTLVVKRNADTGVRDEWQQPTTAITTVATVAGLIQPRTELRSVAEMQLASQAGIPLGDHRAFLRPLAGLDTGCWVEHDGRRFDIIGISDAAGLGHHLELELRRVGP